MWLTQRGPPSAPSPKCLLENPLCRCNSFVAFRGPGGVAHEVPAAGEVVGWLSNEELPVGVLAAVWLERGTCTDDPKQECPRGFSSKRERGGAHGGDHRCGSTQGESHCSRDRRSRRRGQSHSCSRDTQADVAVVGVG